MSQGKIVIDLTKDESDMILTPPIRKRKSDIQVPSDNDEYVQAKKHKSSAEKHKAKEKEPEPEKRLSHWKSSASQATRERIERAKSQKMFLISRKAVEPGNLQREFVVMGTIGNVYNVTIGNIPRCTCPDYKNGNSCKHILFVFLKVLRLPSNSNLIYQKALLNSELISIYEHSPKDPTISVMASLDARQKYAQLSGEKLIDVDKKDKVAQKKQVNGEDCPICYEPMHAHEPLVYCKSSCGNVLHKNCFELWSTQLQHMRKVVTCVYCRADWMSTPQSEAGTSSSQIKEGYLNLSSYQPGVVPEREEYIPETYF